MVRVTTDRDSLLVSILFFRRYGRVPQLVGPNMWSTSSDLYSSVFQLGNYLQNGAFTAPLDGYYFVSAQIRFDSVSATILRLIGALLRGKCAEPEGSFE